ncbi:MAG: hypothetical protein JNJ57_11335 [Saprospiraceae bacterium]|nr:hypothetical protein [Saprospiraceae bacterium]
MRTYILLFIQALAFAGTALTQNSITKDSTAHGKLQSSDARIVHILKHPEKGKMVYDPAVNVEPIDNYIKAGYQFVKTQRVSSEKREKGRFWKGLKEAANAVEAFVTIIVTVKDVFKKDKPEEQTTAAESGKPYLGKPKSS